MRFLINILKFYYDGFRNLSAWGKQVWLIILVKFFILFIILKILFFPNFLKSNFKTNEERSMHVLENLTDTKNSNND